MTIELVDRLSYAKHIEQHYTQAQTMEIVGIACTAFINKLCPGINPDMEDNGQLDEQGCLRKLQQSTLYQGLKQGLRMHVLMLDPNSDYAKTRTRQEGNDKGRIQILHSIRRLEHFASLLRSVRNQDEWRIDGKLKISLYSSNPYVASTRIGFSANQPDTLLLGLMFYNNNKITDYRRVVINDEKDIADALSIHHNNLLPGGNQGGNWVFEWNESGAQFNHKCTIGPGYDTFLCHNSQDKDLVRRLKKGLEWRGVLPWLDEAALPPGQPWRTEVVDILKKVRCIVVCIGENGLGPVQEMECHYYRDLTCGTMIPTVLDGVVGTPSMPTLLSELHYCDLRGRETAIDDLTERIKKCNEY